MVHGINHSFSNISSKTMNGLRNRIIDVEVLEVEEREFLF